MNTEFDSFFFSSKICSILSSVNRSIEFYLNYVCIFLIFFYSKHWWYEYECDTSFDTWESYYIIPIRIRIRNAVIIEPCTKSYFFLFLYFIRNLCAICKKTGMKTNLVWPFIFINIPLDLDIIGFICKTNEIILLVGNSLDSWNSNSPNVALNQKKNCQKRNRQPTSEWYTSFFLHFSCVLVSVRFETNRESSRKPYKIQFKELLKPCSSFVYRIWIEKHHLFSYTNNYCT